MEFPRIASFAILNALKVKAVGIQPTADCIVYYRVNILPNSSYSDIVQNHVELRKKPYLAAIAGDLFK